MSHVTEIKTEITDLNALEAAVNELGGTLVRGQKNFAWYGHHVGDYPLPAGFTKDDMGKCDHAIRIPGASYEVGVVKARTPDGKPVEGKFTLMLDFYLQDQMLKVIGGTKAERLTQLYSVHKATIEAKKKGFLVSRQTQRNGHIKLVVSGM